MNARNQNKFTFLLVFSFVGLINSFSTSAGVFVSDLQATYRNGQTFLTWTCPAGSNYTYKVYRSTTKMDKSGKLNSTKYLGYVIDSSSLNVRKTRKTGVNTFFVIKDGEAALSSTTGLYVVTCDNEASYYYAVTVTDDKKEYKKMTLGSNSLSSPVAEYIAYPQPVLQGTEVLSATGDVAYNYVFFGNNQEVAHYPSMFNQGSYGFNFNLVYRGNYTGGALYGFYEGLEGNAFVGNGLSEFNKITNCIIMSQDDWIPYPNGYTSKAGLNTYWSGYSENFNPYSTSNTVPTSGLIRMYQQHRYIYSLSWASKFLPIDSNRINLVGVSAGGFGVLLTAMMIPTKIAAVYSVCAPVVIKSFNNDGYSLDNEMWGDPGSSLLTDLIDPVTGNGYQIFDLMNIKTMLNKLKNTGIPVIYTIHGKNDNTVTWSDKPVYLNQNENFWQGGVHYWDLREHDGKSANYFDIEITPPFSKFARNCSYPAFSKCNGNGNPGNGDSKNGDSYGAYSGSLDFDSITEDVCTWKVNTSIKDFYVGGVSQNSGVDYYYASVTIRRPQKFAPKDGETIKWKNYNDNNSQIQSGSFVWTAGNLVTIDSVKIKKAGNRLEVERKNCTLKEDDDVVIEVFPSAKDAVAVFNTYNGWKVNFNSSVSEIGKIFLYDIQGKMVSAYDYHFSEGQNTFDIIAPGHGVYLISVVSEKMHDAAKVIY